MNNLFFKIAEKAQRENRLLSVYEEKDNPSKFWVGYVKGLDGENIYLDLVGENGSDEGFSLIKWEGIHQVDYDDRYLRRIQFLHENNFLLPDRDHEEEEENAFLHDTGAEENSSDILGSLIQSVIENNILVEVDFFYDNWIRGYIIDYQENSILVEVISSEGDSDGFSCYHVPDIKSLNGDTTTLKRIEFYYENRKKFYN